MKKLLALLLATTMLLSSTVVYAADDVTTVTQDGGSTATIEVTIDKPETYTCLIPKTISMPVDEDNNATSDVKTISVTGDLYGNRALTVKLPEEITMHSSKGESTTMKASVNKQDTGIFTASELHNAAEHNLKFNVSASDVTAETWVGEIVVNCYITGNVNN